MTRIARCDIRRCDGAVEDALFTGRDGVRRALCDRHRSRAAYNVAAVRRKVRKPISERKLRGPAAPRDQKASKEGRRKYNGRKANDLTAYLGAVHGLRVVTGHRTKTEASGGRSFLRSVLEIACRCGSVKLFTLPEYKRAGVGVCRVCRGAGGSGVAAVKKQSRNDYAAYVGKRYGDLVIESLAESVRPMVVLRCRSGHRFVRGSLEVVTAMGTGQGHRCPDCVSSSAREAAEARRQALSSDGPEVCGCQWFDGRLKTMCRWCKSAQQGAA